MSKLEIIKEIKGIKNDFLNSKINQVEAIECLELFADHLKIDFSILYNAFYSSTPEFYFN